jgi:hypothetical protein
LPFPESVFLGDTVHIRWTIGSATIPSVDLMISGDEGLTWVYLTDPILSSRPDFGDFKWIVRDSVDTLPLLGRTCILKIRDYDKRYEDVSNSFLVADRATRGVRTQGRTAGPALHAGARKLPPCAKGTNALGVRVRPAHGPDRTVAGRALPRKDVVNVNLSR